MADILIVEDDVNINNMIKEALTREGLNCVQAFSGSEGNMILKLQPFNLIILDLMIPGISGEELIHDFRREHTTPIIVVSAKDGLDDKVSLLTSGADDYITKPFELAELTARVNIWLRRAGSVQESIYADGQILSLGELRLNKSDYSVYLADNEISLTRQEFRILELLMTNKGKVFTKQEIYDYAWEEYYEGADKTINVHISNIRSKLKKYTEHEYIETVWGIGFKAKL